jgi:RNA methyltransferase, TrmH family
VITSPQNERIKRIRALQNSAKTRRAEGRVSLEGARLIADALAVGSLPEFVVFTAQAVAQTKIHRLIEQFEQRSIPCLEASPEVFAQAADTQHPQGIIAVCPLPDLPMPEKPGFVLLLDALRDPGNLGTILRSAAAAGVDAVILLPECADPFNGKCLRAGMGAHFRVPIRIFSWGQAAPYVDDIPLYMADAAGSQRYDEIDWRSPAGLIIGGEANGAGPESHARSSMISIPMANHAESLNAASATAVILFEAARQKRHG